MVIDRDPAHHRDSCTVRPKNQYQGYRLSSNENKLGNRVRARVDSERDNEKGEKHMSQDSI